MTLAPGSNLGPYEIMGPLGEGGMGEVYRARDTRLDRIVAIKVLKDKFSERFEREARAISALNHPHICTLYDVGPDYLVMEYVDGKPLRGRVPLDEALRYAVQIAGALDAAHSKGIVHRDLKPGNILLTRSGVKLLDFGLASVNPAPSIAAAAPMATLPMTQAGEIVGTLQYMAPEQLEGKQADERSDIFALGLVLYEMLAGKPAFAGKSQASVIAAIMHQDPPPLATAQPLTPLALERLVSTCLAKDPDARWQSAREVRHALEWISAEPAVPVAARASRNRLPWAIAAVLAIVAVALAIAWRRTTPTPGQEARLSITPPDGTYFPFGVSLGGQAISPDGRMLVLVAMKQDTPLLYVRPLDSLAPRPLAGTEGAIRPFWSPDSRSIGFFAGGRLLRVDTGGGAPQMICEGVSQTAGAWSREDVILFSNLNAIMRVAASGGDPTPASSLPLDGSEFSHANPQFLPDGKHFLYLARSIRNVAQSSVYVGSLDDVAGLHRVRVVDSAYGAGFAPAPGHADQGFLLFVRGTALMAQPFDARKFTLNGEPEVLAQNVRLVQSSALANFSVSRTGVLVYGSGLPLRLTWRDRAGRVLAGAGNFGGDYPHLSPDEKRIAFERYDPNSGRFALWLTDSLGGGETRLTSNNSRYPVWSRDGRDIVYGEPGRGLRRQRVNGVGEETLLSAEQYAAPYDWSPDGRYLLFARASPGTLLDLWVLPVGVGQKPLPYRKTPFVDWRGRFSPNGHWVAYISNETGSYQVFVQGFPEAPGRRQVSADGGIYMLGWRRDGRELFYETDAGDVMALPVEASTDDFRFEAPRRLFRLSEGSNGDVSADGQRFIFAEPGEKQASMPLTVVLNWQAGLKQ